MEENVWLFSIISGKSLKNRIVVQHRSWKVKFDDSTALWFCSSDLPEYLTCSNGLVSSLPFNAAMLNNLKYCVHSHTYTPPPPPTAHVHHVYRLCAHPTQQSSLISAVSGNNEVSIWDMETASRRQMLWASPAQPFSEMTDNVSCSWTTGVRISWCTCLWNCQKIKQFFIWYINLLWRFLIWYAKIQ